MDKQKLIEAICAQLERDLEALASAARAAHEAAVGEESRAENEYDTRGLEASYLAGAQSKRASEIAANLAYVRSLRPRPFGAGETIEATALVELENSGRRSLVFVTPKAGGLTILFEGRSVQTVGFAAPLGEALVGLRAGDETSIETARGVQEYEVVSVS